MPARRVFKVRAWVEDRVWVVQVEGIDRTAVAVRQGLVCDKAMTLIKAEFDLDLDEYDLDVSYSAFGRR
jgi:hypothetical protein